MKSLKNRNVIVSEKHCTSRGTQDLKGIRCVFKKIYNNNNNNNNTLFQTISVCQFYRFSYG